MITLLCRKEGATLAGLKKKGQVLDKGKRDGVTCYRIADAG